MIVYKYFLKLAYRLKSYAIIFLVIFMAMGLSQVLGNNEVQVSKIQNIKS